MKYKILMVGRNKSFIAALDKVAPDMELYLLEEPDLIEHQRQSPLKSKNLQATRMGFYQQSEALLEVAKAWYEEIKFDVVMPGVEYAVLGAGLAADKLGLHYLGAKAVHSLTNKLRLRQLCQQWGIGHPRFAKIQSSADVSHFFQDEKIVIKPANRQASTGVIKVERLTDINQAYAEMIASDEGQRIANRTMHWEYMVEEYMSGLEISIETILKNGKAIFHNITEKKATNTSYFVELGHIVPARLDAIQVQTMCANQNRLITALEAQNGFLHSEWILTNEGPKLIECAGRAAGDHILDLIELAYGFNVYEAIIKTLAGETLSLPQQANYGACIRYFHPQPGTLKEIHGQEIFAQQNPNLLDWSIMVKPGDTISPFTSSWSRVGHVIVTGNNNREAYQQAETLVEKIHFDVEGLKVA